MLTEHDLNGLMAWAVMMLHVEDMREQHPEYRYGQAIFNTLNDRVPEFADQIRGTELDTFHLREGVPVATLFALRDAYLAWTRE